MKKFLLILLFIFVLIISFGIIIYCSQYDAMTEHDMVFAYGRTFFEPEHGRYIATFVNNLLTEKLPEILNIHPNDFLLYVITPVKALMVIISCLFIANTAFLFEKKEKNLLVFPIHKFSFILTYCIIFLLLFNNGYFFGEDRPYFAILENTVFFEYPMSIVVYYIVFGMFVYYFLNETKPNKLNYIILLIMTFFLGITVEALNLPVFVALGLTAFYIIYDFIKNKRHKSDLTKYKYIAGFYLAYFIGLVCYYIKPSKHFPEYPGYSSYSEYITQGAVPFLKSFLSEFIGHSSLVFIPVFILMTLILIFGGELREKTKKIIFLFLVTVSGFILFYLLMFYAGTDSSGRYWFQVEKFVSIYKVVLLFFLLITISLISDNKTEKTSDIIKVVLCLSVLGIFHNNLIDKYIENMQIQRSRSKELRTVAYKAEKFAINTEGPYLILPEEFSNYTPDFWFLDKKEYTCTYSMYLTAVHPKVNKETVIFSDDIKNKVLFTDEELKELKFQNLLTEKMYRHKKPYIDCF